MSNIGKAFTNGKAFIGFLTGGDPSLEKSAELIVAMAAAGADLVEIGIPFSDPIAEGPIIQEANIRALAAGATTEKMFTLVQKVRQQTSVPIVFLTYLNPVFKYGYDAFCARCAAVGVDGLIIPDLPYEERGELLPFSRAHGIDIISLIAPTSEGRIQLIATDATGFIYVVSSMGVTGVRSEIKTDLSSILQTVRSVSSVPTAVGFGINTPDQAEKISHSADGIIVGSAIVKIIAAYGDQAVQPVCDYVKSMKNAMAKK